MQQVWEVHVVVLRGDGVGVELGVLFGHLLDGFNRRCQPLAGDHPAVGDSDDLGIRAQNAALS